MPVASTSSITWRPNRVLRLTSSITNMTLQTQHYEVHLMTHLCCDAFLEIQAASEEEALSKAIAAVLEDPSMWEYDDRDLRHLDESNIHSDVTLADPGAEDQDTESVPHFVDQLPGESAP